MSKQLEEWKEVVGSELPYKVTDENGLLVTMQLYYSLHYHQGAKDLWRELVSAKTRKQFDLVLEKAEKEFPVEENWDKPLYPVQIKQSLPEAVMLRVKRKATGKSISEMFREAFS